MLAEYPNLPLVQERFQNAIYERLLEKKAEIQREKETENRHIFWIGPKYRADVFMQTWANTAGGFQEPGMVSGQALTEQYTTVMYEQVTEIYGVFFGNRLCYLVDNANDAFLEDLKNRNMCCLGDAKNRY